MKKLFSFLLVSLFVVSCQDDGETVEVPSTVYEDNKLTVNVTGLNSNALVSPSVVQANGSTIILNNIADVKSSVILSDVSAENFTYKKTVTRYVADIKGTLSNGVLALTGSIKYTAAGVAREYADKTLIVNGSASASKTKAVVTYTKAATEGEADAISIALTKLVTGSEDDTAAFTVKGTITDNGDGTFALVASGTDKVIKVDVNGTFNSGVLSINIVTTPVAPV